MSRARPTRTTLCFDIAGNPTLSADSAILCLACDAYLTPDNTGIGISGGDVVGGEWEYATALGGAPGGALQGIGSAAFSSVTGGFGTPNFPGPNIAGPASVDGPQMGLLPAVDDPTSYTDVSTEYVRDTVIYTLGARRC